MKKGIKVTSKCLMQDICKGLGAFKDLRHAYIKCAKSKHYFQLYFSYFLGFQGFAT